MKQDIIERSLYENANLRVFFDYWMEAFTDGPDDEVKFSTRLNCFSSGLVSALNEKKISLTSLIGIFNNIEAYLTERKENEDMDTLGLFEVMFFENILNWVSNIEDELEQSYYESLLQENLGPISKELCRNNNEFWQKVILNKNFH